MPEFKLKVEGLQTVTFKTGELVLEEGKPGSKVFVLKEGAVKIEAGGKEICKINDPLTIFGEISVLLDTEHTANVIAVDNCTFYVIDDLIKFGRENPDASLHVARILAARVVNMNNMFMEIKNEILRLQGQETTKKESGKLYRLLVKMDAFWGRDVLHPGTEAKKK